MRHDLELQMTLVITAAHEFRRSWAQRARHALAFLRHELGEVAK